MDHFPRRALLTAGTLWALTSCASQDSLKSESPADHQASQAPDSASTSSSPVEPGPSSEALPSSSSSSLDHFNPDSIYVLVNKLHPLNPPAWEPSDLVNFGGVLLRAEAANQAEKMLSDATLAGAGFMVKSGYRSYATQEQTYASWVASQGQEMADVASARAGYSEHQTGLALDVGTGTGCDLQPCFRDTAAAIWLAQNSWKYGFILRFPWMQHEITGYWFESWHFRFIGLDQAQSYHQSNATTLEEFWGFSPAPKYSS